MFFKKLFLATVLTVCLNGLAFGQEVCGWVPVTKENAPQILKDRVPDEWFVDDGDIEISEDHSPWGKDNQYSLKFTDLGSAEEIGYKFYMKEYNISIGDTFSIFAECRGFPDYKQTAGRFYLISKGEFYSTSDWDAFDTVWTEPMDFGWFDQVGGQIATNLDTLIICIWWCSGGPDPIFPFGAHFDNLTYEKIGGEKVVFDKMGDGQAVEEPKKKMNNSMLVKISPNPFCSQCRIFAPENTTEIEIFGLSGRKIKTLREPAWDGKTNDGNEVQAGFYFIKAGKYKPVKVVKLR